MIVKVLGHILLIFGSILAPKMVPKSLFFRCRKTPGFEVSFFHIVGVFLVIFGVDFRTLRYSKMSISSRRNTDFHKFGLPKSRSKNESPQSSEQMRFGVNFGPLFWAFLLQKRYQKSSQKKSGEKVEKKWSPDALSRSGSPPRDGFWDPNSLLGGRGV